MTAFQGFIEPELWGFLRVTHSPGLTWALFRAREVELLPVAVADRNEAGNDLALLPLMD